MNDEIKVTVLPIGVMEGGELVTIEQLTAERDALRAEVARWQNDAVIVRTFQHRGEEPEHWVKLEDFAELVKAAQAAAEECEAADKYGEAVGQVDAEGIAESLRAALKPFEGP